ncbi:outer membrane beta-barrel protein, partial [Myxococcota bacterium]|nr:outer membrane beta-barrel protein [Myxococcota bacterium]
QYAPPIGPEGTVMKAGKFATLIGAEVPGTIYNYNITRGQVRTLLEPIDHIGVMAGGPIGDSGFSWGLGGVNGFLQDSPDINDGKSITWHLGWGNDQFSVGTNGIWGPETSGFDGDEAGLVNLLAKWTPSDRFGMYANGIFAWMDDPHGTDLDPYAWGVSLAGRYGITERTGFALRGDFVKDSDGFVLFSGRSGGLQYFSGKPAELNNVWSITGTLDHLLTDQLMVRAEARYDKVDLDDADNEVFLQNTKKFGPNGGDQLFQESDQITLFFEVVYNFNKFIGD